jgi:transposase-like protein
MYREGLNSTIIGSSPQHGITEGARRATGVSPCEARSEVSRIIPSDPEVPEKKPRRKFTAKYKLEILEKVETCTRPSQIGLLLRKEGLYSSNLTTWRKQRDKGLLEAMTPKKRGRKKVEKNPLAQEVARLQGDNERLKKKLKQAETIIEVQKKISQILGISQDHDEESIS